ncbi:MAG: hypothetical protein ACI9JN_002590 [Bacteroidia bacterium]|jgi:hypothetical protein
MKQLIYIALIIGCLSCKTETIPSPKSHNTAIDTVGYHSDFELVWSKLAENSLICRGTFVYDEGVVFFSQSDKSNARDNIVSLDKITGDTLWVWDEGPYYTNHRYLVDNTLYFTAGTSVYSLDCITGKTNWEYRPPDLLSYMSLSASNKGIYVSYQDRGNDPLQYESILYELSPEGFAEEILRLNASTRNHYTFNFDHVTPWIHPNGDKILFCESRSWNYGPKNDGIGEYLAYNQTTRVVYKDWGNLFNTIDIGGRALIHKGTVYLSSGWSQIAAIKLLDSKILWRHNIVEQVATASLMPLNMFSNRLYVSLGNQSHLNVFNTTNGKRYKTIDNIGTEWFATAFKTYNNHLWFTSTAGLYKLDQDATIVSTLNSDELVGTNAGTFTHGMDIDDSTGLIYTTRGNQFICLRDKH